MGALNVIINEVNKMEDFMKSIKNLLLILLVLTLSLGMMLSLASCGGEENPEGQEPGGAEGDGKTDYTVTVKDKEGNLVSGAKVEILLDGVAPVGSAETTGADGKAIFKIKDTSKTYHAKVTKAPEGYKASSATVKLENFAATVEIEKLPVYTVYVKDASGNPIAGAAVQICSLAGACQLPKLTDSEGKIASPLESGDYKAMIVGAPEEYAYTDDYFVLVGNTVTIVLQAK